jgi:4-hydroxy-3-methylbut-2-enyl diphosphate reductase
VQQAADIPWSELKDVTALGITAGASAPELLVTEILDAFRDRYAVSVESVATTEERIAFNVPRELREAGAL